MPLFKYQAVDARGQTVRGSREFPSKKEVIAFLRGERLTPTSIEELGGGARAAIARSFSSAAKPKYKSAAKMPGKIKVDDVALFCRQLATLVGAGVNLLEAVDDIADMSNNPKMRATLKEVAENLRSGTPLSDALKKHSKTFNKTLTSMVEVGERSGKLAKVLGDLALYLENNVKLIRKIKSASTYPMFIGIFFILVLLALIVGIIPRFEEMFLSFGADLPTPTKIVMNISRFVIGNALILVLSAVFLIVGFVLFKKTPRGNLLYCRALFKMPIFGKIYMKMVLARFFQTLSTLVKSGVDIVASLEISSNVMDNSFAESIMRNVRARVLEGNQLGMEMEKYEMFPRMVTRMTIVGEKSGQLDAMFDKITDYFTDEVDAAVATISSIIEPVLIIGLGFIVGLAVTSMYLPIFYLASAMMG